MLFELIADDLFVPDATRARLSDLKGADGAERLQP